MGELIAGCIEISLGLCGKSPLLGLILCLFLSVFATYFFLKEKKTCAQVCAPAQHKVVNSMCMCKVDKGWFVKDIE